MVAWDNKEVRTETNNSQIKWFLMAGGGVVMTMFWN